MVHTQGSSAQTSSTLNPSKQLDLQEPAWLQGVGDQERLAASSGDGLWGLRLPSPGARPLGNQPRPHPTRVCVLLVTRENHMGVTPSGQTEARRTSRTTESSSARVTMHRGGKCFGDI